MSGLIAAINLARDGHKVVVHDREADFGGDSLYNPSTHMTPIDLKRTSEYIGIDISSVFHPLSYFPVYFHDTRIQVPPRGFYSVERGKRPTSLDTLLYQEAVGAGVDFRFNSPLRREDLKSLPAGTIIACGLTPDAYEMLSVPYLRWYGWISRGEFERDTLCWIWADESITEYGYLSSANNYYFDLLFSIRPIGKEALVKYEDFMKRNEGVKHEEWKYVSGAVPIGSAKNPRLTQNGLILCGTMAGYMDPMFWFGILGALVSGKVSALAVTDRVKAQQELRRFTRLFALSYFMKNSIWYRFLRPHVRFLEGSVKFVGVRNVEKIAGWLMKKNRAFSIPGFSHLGCN
jgi:flavin-dependent dehydrogenase